MTSNYITWRQHISHWDSSPGVSSAAHKDHRSSLTSLVTFYSYHTGSFHLFTAPITSEEPDVYVYSFGARDGEATVVVNDKL